MKIKWPAFRCGCLLIAGVAVAALPVRPQDLHNAAATLPAASASISSVEVAHAGGQTTVQIRGTEPLHYQESRLQTPPRLVLDFADTQVTVAQQKIPSDFLPVRGVRIGQLAGGKSRIVIDLAAFGPYHIEAGSAGITVSFAASDAIPVATNAPAMALPAWMTDQAMTLARPASQPAAPARQNAPTLTPVAQQTPIIPEQQQFTGEPISVNLKDVDLKDFFRLIHEISGLNVVLDPSVRGTVTLVLDNVPWDQALDIVLRNNGLAKQVDGNVLRIATQDTVKHEAEQRRDLAKAEQDSVDTVTVTRVLSYAKADTLKVTLQKFLSSRGSILSDTRSNTLIISDIPEYLPKVDDLLRQLDRKSKQVEIDARVVSASRSFARDIGTQFGFSTTLNSAGTSALGGLVGQAAALSPIGHIGVTPPFATAGATTGSSIPFSSNFPAVAPTSGITFSTQGQNYAIDFLLTAMENKGAGKVLSEPKGVTQNNEKLTVKQGTKLPIQTTINNTISIQFVDAVLMLEVTPQITSDGTVFMEVHVENTAIDAGIPRILGVPALDTQSAETKVLIADGGTVVVGGVVLSSERTNVNQVPLVGSIPLIGHLFKETAVTVSSQELLFFVTPRILPG